MEFNGREMQQIQNRYGLSPTVVCTEAGISINTLYAVYGNKPSVKSSSVNKVKEALHRLTSRQLLQSKSMAAG